MRHPAPLPPSLRTAPFTLAQARSVGVEPGRLRRRDIRRLARGLYRWEPPPSATSSSPSPVPVPGPDSTRPTSARARGTYSWSTPLCAEEEDRLTLLAPRRASVALSHQTLARVEGLWLPPRLDRPGDLHISRRRTRARLEIPGVLTHRTSLSPHELTRATVGGMTWHVTTRTRLWLDLGALLSLQELIVLGDHLVTRAARDHGADPSAFLASLIRAVEETPSCRNHRRRLREAAAQLRVGAHSPPETRLRLALLSAGLPEPELQLEVWDPEFSPMRPASADLGYWTARLAIHVDGGHHGQDRQIDRDVQRNAAFERRGFWNLTASSSDARNGFTRIIREVRSRLGA